jgi:hypothetical protein
LLGALVLGWAAGVSVFLLHRIVVTNDSMSNYGHVWLISDFFQQHHHLPWRLDQLSHGDAPAYPYGFVAWTTAALVRPALGDWVCTLWMVIGIAGVISGTFLAFPEVRRPAAAACILANPILVETIVLFQMPFAWAAAMFLFGIWAYRTDRFWIAVILVGAAQANHAPVLMPIVGLAVLINLRFADRRRMLTGYGVSLLIAAPAAVIVLASPEVGSASRATLVGNLLGTVSLRSLVFLVPVLAAILSLRRPSWLLPAAVGLVALNVILVPLRHNEFAWGLFFRQPDTEVSAFARTPAFEPGATYRILRSGDGKVGMYQLIRAGARLDSEFFPESIDRRSWDSTAEYAKFLEGRSVEYVMLFDNYSVFETNEASLLNTMTTDSCAAEVVRNPDFVVYRVHPANCAADVP